MGNSSRLPRKQAPPTARSTPGANRIAHSSIREGLQPGERVVVVMENSLDSAGLLRHLKAGGVSVEVPDRSTPSEVAYFIGNCGARACILSKAAPDAWRASTSSSSVLDMSSTLPAAPISPGAACRQCRKPAGQKGRYRTTAAIAHLGLHRQAQGRDADACQPVRQHGFDRERYLGLTPTDRAMVILPFHYVYGKTLLNTHFASRAAGSSSTTASPSPMRWKTKWSRRRARCCAGGAIDLTSS